jgi:hypothetical protein
MSCTRCGSPLPDDATACASCGTPRAAATPGARELLGNLGRAAARADERLRDPALAERIPGGSLAVVGYAALLLACLLDVLPFADTGRLVSYGWRYSKLGHFWDVVLPVLALAALMGRLYAAKDPRASRLAHPALHSAVAVLALAQAYLLFDVSVIPLLVLLAALILVYDAVRSGLAGMAVRAVGERLDAIGNGTVIGVALCLVALALAFLPGSHNWLGGFLVLGQEGVDKSWAAILVLGGVAAIALDRSPEKPFTPFVIGGYVLLQVAFVIVEFTLAIVPVVWVTGAVFAARDQWRKADARTGGELTLRQLTAGPRRLVLAGVPICLLALSFKWSESATNGYYSGGYESSYSSYYGGYVSSYSYVHTYNPGFTFSGTGFQQGPGWLSFSPVVVAGLLVLLVLAVWRSTRPVPTWAYLVPGGIVAAIGLWTLVHLAGGFGPWAFLPGLALLGLAAFTVGLPTVREMTAARAAATSPGTAPAPGEPPAMPS